MAVYTPPEGDRKILTSDDIPMVSRWQLVPAGTPRRGRRRGKVLGDGDLDDARAVQG